MSRTGKLPIKIVSGVSFSMNGSDVTITGPKGTLSFDTKFYANVENKDGAIVVSPKDNNVFSMKIWGTIRSILNNMVIGVTEGFKKDLELFGVGYRANVQGNKLVLNLGYSHDINFEIPNGIKILCPEPTKITVEGIDKELVGQVAANIKKYRKIEPYKGKGVRYAGQRILRKEGKKK